jgi:hypothetical protein
MDVKEIKCPSCWWEKNEAMFSIVNFPRDFEIFSRMGFLLVEF